MSSELNEKFANQKRVVEALGNTLKRKKDKEICDEILGMCEKLGKQQIADVIRELSVFMETFIKIVQWTVENQPSDIYEKWRLNSNIKSGDEDQSFSSSIERKVWLQKENKYMATKTLPCGIHMVYIATACDPKAGWQEKGLKLMRKATADV